ncbi:MAG TPA: helix-turn-helix domain-containing protein [Acidimicrobiales bacterium]|nr:helix-turn-helix domain-containing protein [Acidimicrobiales bacterium]
MKTARAAALPPEARRQCIAEATLGLLLARGPGVTTRQIAEAAGVAEGTIFRAFADKDAVLRAAIDLAFDTAPTERALEAIDRSRSLAEQLADAVRIIQERNSSIWRVVEAVGDTDVLRDREHQPPPDLVALADLLRPHRHELRHEPALAARELRALTLALTHPALFGDEPMSPDAIVELLLHGIRGPKGSAPC